MLTVPMLWEHMSAIVDGKQEVLTIYFIHCFIVFMSEYKCHSPINLND